MPDNANANASANPRPEPVQRPLTLVMPVKPDHGEALRRTIEHVAALPGKPIETALETVGNVHFARFVLLENDTRLAVITTYDDDFDDYVNAFVTHLGDTFNELLQLIEDAPSLPVQDHRAEFIEYVRERDVPYVGSFYSAYPQLRVSDITQRKAPAVR